LDAIQILNANHGSGDEANSPEAPFGLRKEKGRIGEPLSR
jgi:hypothetical protein